MNNLKFVEKVQEALKDKELEKEIIWLMASKAETKNGSDFKTNEGYYKLILQDLLDNMLSPLSDDNSHYADDYLSIIKVFFFGYFRTQSSPILTRADSTNNVWRGGAFLTGNENKRLLGDVSES